MRNDEDIKDIISELRDLQIHQATLISRLERLSESGNNATEPAPPAGTTRRFAIGDRVRIKNPGILQANKGTIEKIGASRILVRAPNGKTIVRAPKNLYFE
jgi:hypothetical protein